MEMSKALIHLKEITKTYTLGEQIVHALQHIEQNDRCRVKHSKER